jgi:hypothetical protein
MKLSSCLHLATDGKDVATIAVHATLANQDIIMTGRKRGMHISIDARKLAVDLKRKNCC